MSSDESIQVELVEMSPNDSYDESFKVSIIGDTLVGKSSIIQRALGKGFNDLYTQTFGFEFSTLGAKINDKILKLQIWDFSGLPKIITSTLLSRSKLAILL